MAMSSPSSQPIKDQKFKSPLGLEILICHGDITETVAGGIVVPEGKSFGKTGFVATRLIETDAEFKRLRDKLIVEKKAKFKLWEVYTTKLEKRFEYAIHAIVSPCKDEQVHEWKRNMKNLYQQIFQEADKKLESVSVPLLGSGKGKASREDAIGVAMDSAVQYKAKYQLKMVMFVSNDDDIVGQMISRCDWECKGRPNSDTVTLNRPLPPVPRNWGHKKPQAKSMSVNSKYPRSLPPPPQTSPTPDMTKEKVKHNPLCSDDSVRGKYSHGSLLPKNSTDLRICGSNCDSTVTKIGAGRGRGNERSRGTGGGRRGEAPVTQRDNNTRKHASNTAGGTDSEVWEGDRDTEMLSSRPESGTCDPLKKEIKQNSRVMVRDNNADIKTNTSLPREKDKKSELKRLNKNCKFAPNKCDGGAIKGKGLSKTVGAVGAVEENVGPYVKQGNDKPSLSNDDKNGDVKDNGKTANSTDSMNDDKHILEDDKHLIGSQNGHSGVLRGVKNVLDTRIHCPDQIETDATQDDEADVKVQQETGNAGANVSGKTTAPKSPEQENHDEQCMNGNLTKDHNVSAANTSGSDDTDEMLQREVGRGGKNMKRSKGIKDPEERTNRKIEESKDESKTQICPICLECVTNPKQLKKCGHVFCRDCIDDSFKHHKPVCPTCNMVYGVLEGNQPVGEMNVKRNTVHLPGYEEHGTIIITYRFPNGVQTDEHPNPGQRYHGTTRTAYLPDCPEGKKVLQLLETAFNRKLTFTIGRSTTTGRDNVVTWNDIHHKTSVDGGPTRFGYPDPGYLRRVKEELASKGITD